MDTQVARELVQPAEALVAPGKAARVGLFARVCSDVTSLVFKPVEGLIAHGTFVRSGRWVLSFGLDLGRHHSRDRAKNLSSKVWGRKKTSPVSEWNRTMECTEESGENHNERTAHNKGERDLVS